MFYRTIITIRAAFARWKARVADALLGYTARAGHIVADADARLIGMTPPLRRVRIAPQAPFFNHLAVITSQ